MNICFDYVFPLVYIVTGIWVAITIWKLMDEKEKLKEEIFRLETDLGTVKVILGKLDSYILKYREFDGL